MPTVADILNEHVVLNVECFDRLYLNGYIPCLQTEGQLMYFLTQHLGNKIPSPALLGRITNDFVKRVESFISNQDVPCIQFKKKQRKDTIANDLRSKDPRHDVVLFVGTAQEKQQAFKGNKVRDPKSQYVSFSYSRQSVFVKHYYFYIDDADFGPCFIKIGTYAPFPIRVCINGHEWAKRQLENKAIAYESLDNGFLSCPEPKKMQKICEQLGPQQIERFFRKWIRRLPFPLSAKDIRAGYRHELSLWQMELSSTQVFDRPVRGRQFFEAVIRENIDLGRPDRVQLLFDRKIIKTTPGIFRTRIITHGVSPSLHIGYKSTDIKQYFKENRAIRTECTINNTQDFGVNKRLKNLPYLKQIAHSINQRLLEVERVSEDCVLSEASVERLTQPTVTDDGQKAPGFRFGDPRVMALFAALTSFLHLPNGFRNRDLCHHIDELLGGNPCQYHAGKMTYDLRRLRIKGVIARVPHTNRYFLTPYGYRVSLFLTRLHARLFRPGFACLEPGLGTHVPHPLRNALDKVNIEVDKMLEKSRLKPTVCTSAHPASRNKHPASGRK
jgi:hypothetical protein